MKILCLLVVSLAISQICHAGTTCNGDHAKIIGKSCPEVKEADVLIGSDKKAILQINAFSGKDSCIASADFAKTNALTLREMADLVQSNNAIVLCQPDKSGQNRVVSFSATQLRAAATDIAGGPISQICAGAEAQQTKCPPVKQVDFLMDKNGSKLQINAFEGTSLCFASGKFAIDNGLTLGGLKDLILSPGAQIFCERDSSGDYVMTKFSATHLRPTSLSGDGGKSDRQIMKSHRVP